MPTGTLLQARADCTVVVEAGGAVVTKTFRGDDRETQWRLAREEFDRLLAFSRALSDVDWASCPEPLEVVPGPMPRLRMARADGVSLKTVLRRRRVDPALREHLAATAARALGIYIGCLDEPYYDFHFDNMLYDERSNTLSFVDLGLPARYEEAADNPSPAEISLGNLIGATIFESAKPNEVLWRRQHRQAASLCADLAGAVIAANAVDMNALSRCVRAAYARAAHHGRPHRRLWYRTVGALLARPMVIDHRTFTA